MLSFWEKKHFLKSDFIIIGAGISGLSTALSLRERFPKKEITVLERGFFPSGASTKNAGFACFGSLTEILSDLKTLSEEDVFALVKRRWEGLQKLENRLGADNLGLQKYGGYELLNEGNINAFEELDKVNRMLKPLFKANVFEEAPSSLRSFGFRNVTKLIKNRFEAQIDTGLMMKNLINLCGEKRINLLNGFEVTHIEETGSSVKINGITLSGESLAFQAFNVAVCTNAFSKRLLPDLKLRPGRGQVLITKPLSQLPFKGVFHYESGFFYFRNFGNRIIFGGGRHLDIKEEESEEFKLNNKLQERLNRDLNEIILPGQNIEVEHRWAGIMAFGDTKQTIVKRLNKRIVVGVRLNGMGVAIGSQIGEEVAELLFQE